jgi:hypothetical protein
MIKLKKMLWLTSAAFCFMSCRPDHYFDLSIKNNSDSGIYYTYSTLYPDTAVDTSVYIPPGSTRTPSEVIYPGQTNTVIAIASLQGYFSTIPSDTLEIFIYDAKLVQRTSWDSVVAKYLVLKRYDLTLQEIEKMNGIVTYP